jgi:hypothetical protein
MNPVIMRTGLAALALVLAQVFAFGEGHVPRLLSADTSLQASAERVPSGAPTVR